MKTAVEELVEDLIASGYLNYEEMPKGLIFRAKQMEKEQIEKGFDEGYTNGGDNWGYGSDKTGEQYYNETFKSE